MLTSSSVYLKTSKDNTDKNILKQVFLQSIIRFLEGWQSGNAAPWKGVVGNGAGVRFPHLPPDLLIKFSKIFKRNFL